MILTSNSMKPRLVISPVKLSSEKTSLSLSAPKRLRVGTTPVPTMVERDSKDVVLGRRKPRLTESKQILH